MNTQEAPPFPPATVKAWSEAALAGLLEQAFRSARCYGPNPLQDMARHAAKVVLSHASATSSFLLKDAPAPTPAAKDAEITSLRARLAAAEAALRPIADAASDLDDNESGEIWERPAAMSIDCDHLRAAAAYFATKEPPHD